MCEARQKETCYFFEARGDGFTAKIDLSKENLVFFSVPWEEGWTATVDGQPVEIERVNVAFMAVDVPAGDHVIEFHYMTPGLKTGALITLICVAIFVAYLIVMARLDKKRKARRNLLPEEGELKKGFLEDRVEEIKKEKQAEEARKTKESDQPPQEESKK